MSLAEDVRRSFDPGGRERPARGAQRGGDGGTPGTVHALRPDGNLSAGPTPRDAAAESMNLLDRASKSVLFLLSRYQQLEEHVRQLDAWSKAQIQATESAAARWQGTAEIAEAKVQAMQAALDIMLARAEAAEQALQRDTRALETLQERIVAAFGVGSEAHDALSAVGVA